MPAVLRWILAVVVSVLPPPASATAAGLTSTTYDSAEARPECP